MEGLSIKIPEDLTGESGSLASLLYFVDPDPPPEGAILGASEIAPPFNQLVPKLRLEDGVITEEGSIEIET